MGSLTFLDGENKLHAVLQEGRSIRRECQVAGVIAAKSRPLLAGQILVASDPNNHTITQFLGTLLSVHDGWLQDTGRDSPHGGNVVF